MLLKSTQQSTLINISLFILISATLFACSASRKDISLYQNKNNIDELISVVENGDKNLRISALRAISNMGNAKAVPILNEVLDSDSWVEREAAINALAKIRRIQCLEPLIKALGDDNKFVREQAAKGLIYVTQALTKSPKKLVFAHLIKGVASKSRYVRQQTSVAFQSLIERFRKKRDEEIIDVLISYLKHKNWYIRNQVTLALGPFNNPRIVNPLAAMLLDSSREVRRSATQSLYKITDYRSIGDFCELLNHENERFRDEIILVLSGFKYPLAINEFILQLEHKQARVREGVIQVLAYIKPAKALPKLPQLLKDENAEVRLSSAKLLEAMHWKPENDEQKVRFCVAKKQWNNCNDVKVEAAQPIIIALRDDDESVRQAAAKTLSEIEWKAETVEQEAYYCVALRNWEDCESLGEAAIPALKQALQSENLETQIRATRSLGKIDHVSIVDPLIKMLRNVNPEVRLESIAALNQLEEKLFLYKKIVPAYIAALEDNNPHVRKASQNALRKAVDAATKSDDIDQHDYVRLELEAALKDNNRNVRQVATLFLGNMRDSQSVATLILALKDVDAKVKALARDALNNINDHSAIDALVIGLQDSDPDIRIETIKALARFKDEKVVTPIVERLKDPYPKVRIAAIRTLGALNYAQAVMPMLISLTDYNTEVRVVMAHVLGTMQDERASPALATTLEDHEVLVRESAGQALKKLKWLPETKTEKVNYCIAIHDWDSCLKLKHHAVEPLFKELNDPNISTRVQIIRTLGEIGQENTIDRLIKAFRYSYGVNDSDDYRALIDTIYRALDKFGDKVTPYLLPNLTNWYAAPFVVQLLEKQGWKPTNDNELVYLMIAKRDQLGLNNAWDKTKKILLSDIKSKNKQKLKNALYTLIGLGKNETEQYLVDMLDSKGTLLIAEAYLNSDNSTLVSSAVSWSMQKDMNVSNYGKGNSPVTWGNL